ncbi:glycosyltransferase family 4 protein [Salinisphaera aquimarina]|uniref:Glycosyltransferase family 4 protein n=1 Tax=Salinisphaera aquimarina TaxID=2094031 RepID=A0ABV7EL61_9GAMM
MHDDPPIRIAHYVSLSGFGGVEQQFAAFAARAARIADVQQSVVACSNHVHPHHGAVLDDMADWRFEKKIGSLRLGHRPAVLRRMRYAWLARRLDPDVALLWNRLGQQQRVLDALGPRRCLYWEHGSAWLAGESRAKADTLARLPAVICNSVAAKRMLELRWNYAGVARVCLNGMRAPSTIAQPRARPSHRGLRLGVACRLVPIKATCLALHALAALRARDLDATLVIAGDGPLRGALEAQAVALGVRERVEFLGVVRDMPAFFADIDMLLHPALREPFGVVAAEAGAAGCPVICTAVDGLPEVVAHGETGLCVPATADLARYRELGGISDGLPPAVYVPARDRVEAPMVCEPQALADAVTTLSEDPALYARMSAAAIERVAKRFDFDRHVDEVLAAAREYAATGTLEALS